ncbi:hypothetical protein TRP8649_01453 [Pelagimonas phthalicica]|uniref:DUF4132 domain-containing protein n=1 Tax=Pelagimonas phthalicica TaxID=1037362 RepID=A0A238J9T5_9RHOB|nr:DUF4132 domain-containing protein [Pelagimonas phthalicica]TDS94125.1 uncharacterized protein DUF4132 [Pelagimonas phthalicica]SMX27349.1 hypothetical protein TRP8649_01453 [Pelagimonas phthalicica]
MRNIISNFLNLNAFPSPLVKDLQRLDSIQKGLANKALTYVCKGTEGSVLSTLANVDAASALGLENNYSDEPGDRARRLYLAREAKDASLLARYGEVLAAAMGGEKDYLVGSKHVPLSLRVLFTKAGMGLVASTRTWPRKFIDAKSCVLAPEFCLTICNACGGSAADLFDILYNDEGRWGISEDIRGLTDIFDFAPTARSHVSDLLIAGRRMGASGRVALIKQLRDWNMLTLPEVNAYLVDMLADGAKSVRQEAIQAMMTLPEDQTLAIAKDKLATGNVSLRGAIVELLTGLRSDTGFALLRDHLKTEKTARIKAAIESALSVKEVTEADDTVDFDGTSYLALDGSRVDIPPRRPLSKEPNVQFGAEDQKILEQIIAKENQEIDQRNAVRKAKMRNVVPRLKTSFAKQVLKVLNGPVEDIAKGDHTSLWRFLNYTARDTWTVDALTRMSQDRALRFAASARRDFDVAFHLHEWGAMQSYLVRYVTGSDADYRNLEALNVEMGEIDIGPWSNRKTRKAEPGDLLRAEIGREWADYDVMDLNREAIWPFLAESFDVFDEAFGLRPAGEPVPRKIRAIAFLRLLPKTPQRYYGPLLEIATGATKTGRAEARAMLQGAPGLVDRAVALLDDTRQDARAGAAEWLADLGAKEAVKPLKARLKKEKSDLAKAAILTALSRLDVDLSDYVGPKALLLEAEKLLKKAKFDKLDWLVGDHLPALKYKGGQKVPPEVIKAWVFLANKLKQPGGNALFDIYLAQLAPESARTLSTWIFDAWINYDTVRPSDDEANAHAEQHADRNWQSMKRWIKDYTREQAFRDLHNEFKSQYLNSGAASKGILALTKQVDPAHAAATIRTYLKQHGSRTSQASALLDLLAAKGDPVSLQIVISAATRLKQKGVQAHAGKLVEAVAETRGWSMDELTDRTIPTAGLNDDGILELPIGEEAKPYSARMDDAFKLVVLNPDGKAIKALPAGDDDNTKASKKQLSAAKRELKQVITLQGERLYEALCAERRWQIDDWIRDFRQHPLMGRLTERVIWLGEDAQGQVVSAFRPTAEGDYVDADDNEVDPLQFSAIRLAHGALLSETEAQAWESHLADYEVKPLFAQFGRPLLALEGEMGKATQIEDRKGWVTDTFSFRGASSKLGYERGEALDGGYFNEYVKTFRSAGLCAVIEFSGNCLPEENVAAAQISLEFVKLLGNNRRGRAMPLSDVPPVLLSECWNDYRDMVAKGAFDPDWEKKMPWM